MLIIVGGPMFSGKTTWLINYMKNLPPDSFAVFKPDIDTRYKKSAVVTHHGLTYPARNIDSKEVDLPVLGQNIRTVIFDEINFLSPKPLSRAIKEQRGKGRTVVGAGLLYDYKKEPFGATLALSRKADKFIQLYARCDGCQKKATHSYRKVRVKKQFLLGAKKTYGACCERCWDVLSGHIIEETSASMTDNPDE